MPFWWPFDLCFYLTSKSKPNFQLFWSRGWNAHCSIEVQGYSGSATFTTPDNVVAGRATHALYLARMLLRLRPIFFLTMDQVLCSLNSIYGCSTLAAGPKFAKPVRLSGLKSNPASLPPKPLRLHSFISQRNDCESIHKTRLQWKVKWRRKRCFDSPRITNSEQS